MNGYLLYKTMERVNFNLVKLGIILVVSCFVL
jgi:hypothetical protein